MPDRLAQLRRQRALAQEQLDWLDREIATAEAGAGVKPGPATELTAGKPGSVSRPAVHTPSDAATSAAEDEILAHYRAGPDALKHDVRKGCLIYFAVALLLLAAGVAILYFSLRTR